jgi:uncharacterized OB-fold protein
MEGKQDPASPAEALSAPYVLAYTYRRSVGPVIGRFLTGLREGRIEGVRTAAGRVLVPPAEYDPETGAAVGDFVEVGTAGVVQSWCWVSEPRAGQPLDRPFAWALVKLDGADTAMVHAVDAPSPAAMRTGMRVCVRWRAERVGSVRDIACFVPDEGSGASEAPPMPPAEPVRGMLSPVHLEFTISPGATLSRFLEGVVEGKLLGRRCPSCAKVYVPPKGACPTCGVPFGDEVAVSDTGTVTSFCIVNVPFEGQTMKLPYTYGSVLLDGADIPILHLISGIPADEVRMGLRVRAEWLPAGERRPTLESIRWFAPTGEPDAAYETFSEHQ